MIMRLRQLIQDLPQSLLLISLAISCSAVPVKSALPPPLTPENFKSTVSKGLWYVEHFSPHCWHCQQFLPTWEELLKLNDKGEFPGMHMAQVDCAVHGDLCESNGVKGYPTMTLFKDGLSIDQFKGSRDLDRLKDFLQKHTAPSSGAASTHTDAVSVNPIHNLNPSGDVLVLDPNTFQENIDKGPAFVKFYAPWCGHCKKLAPVWKKLAKHLQSKLTVAEVNCDDHKALCVANGVTGYPALMYYTAGSRTEFNGGRKLEKLIDFTEKASASPTEAITSDVLFEHILGNDVVYVLLYDDPQVLLTLNPLFGALLGSPKVLTIRKPSSSLYSGFSIPSDSAWALVAFKDKDFRTPTSVLHGMSTAISATDKVDISNWLASGRMPTTLELTQDSFQFVMNAAHKPLVVIAAVTKDNKDQVKARFESLSKVWRERTHGSGRAGGHGREVIFAWMDIVRWKDWMKSMYGLTAKDGHNYADVDLVVADHHELIYYATDLSGEPIKLGSDAKFFAAIEAVAEGKIRPIYSENFVERTARLLNQKLTGLEQYIFDHPMYTVFLFCVAFIFIILAAKRFFADDPEEFEHSKKGGRLD